MKSVIISPYSKKMRNGKRHPKNYPHWIEVISGLRNNKIYVTQIGIDGEEPLGADTIVMNAPIKELYVMADNCDTWASVDNFFQHLCYLRGKKGVAIFGMSDPLIFGHKENLNLLKDRKYLKPNQFNTWEECEFNEECFVSPQTVVSSIMDILIQGESNGIKKGYTVL